MLTLALGISYIAICWMCRSCGSWSPLFFPHNFCSSRPELAPLVLLPVFLLSLLLAFFANILPSNATAVISPSSVFECISMSIFLGLSLDAVRRLRASLSPVNISADSTYTDDSTSDTPSFLLIHAHESELLRLDADFRLSGIIEKTPFRHTRVTTFEVAPIIQEIAPSATLVPWTEELHSAIVAPHEEAISLSKEKISDAMASDSNHQAVSIELAEVKAKLDEALAANRKYEKVLQDLRTRPQNAPMTPAAATPATTPISDTIKRMQDYGRKV